VRVGNWLSIQQAQKLLNTPDVTTKKGLRDRAMLAVVLAAGSVPSRTSTSVYTNRRSQEARQKFQPIKEPRRPGGGWLS
jgi:site-specific recombinase XerD